MLREHLAAVGYGVLEVAAAGLLAGHGSRRIEIAPGSNLPSGTRLGVYEIVFVA